MDRNEDSATHSSTDAARAGTTPGIVRYVLGISMIAAVVLLGMLLFAYR